MPWPRQLARLLGLAGVLALPAVGTAVAGLAFADAEQLHARGEVLLLGVWLGNAMVLAWMIFLLAVGHRLLRSLQRGRAWALVLLAVGGAVAALFAVGVWESLAHEGHGVNLVVHPYAWQLHLMVAGGLVGAAEMSARSRSAARAAHAADLHAMTVEAELASARLQLLQAQVEPHFLFNSLANLRRLQRTDPPAARDMLSALLRYLEEALPRLREDRTTLGREVELVRAFLAVHQVRMGPRLQVHIDVPATLADRPVPPMSLLTLVENAIKHGLAPQVGGGAVSVLARQDGSNLVLSVADTGRGMAATSGGGTGLANLQARLKAAHGAGATLSLRVNAPQGVVATLVVPPLLRSPSVSHAPVPDVPAPSPTAPIAPTEGDSP